MAKYLFAYKGGRVPDSDSEREAVTAAWGSWLGGLGAAAVDPGNPFGPSKSVASDGSVSDGTSSGLSGYSVVEAGSLDEAIVHASTCPVLANGGEVEVHETFEVM